MPSLDIVSRVDHQEIDNAVNNTRKALAQRFDFRGSKTQLTYDRKAGHLSMLTEDKMKMEAVREMFLQAAAKRKIELRAFDFAAPEPAAGGDLKRTVTVREGLSQDLAKHIVKAIKATKMKVQASIQGDEVRLSGKKIDDLRACMDLLRADERIDVPLQFVNMKS